MLRAVHKYYIIPKLKDFMTMVGIEEIVSKILIHYENGTQKLVSCVKFYF